MDCFFQDFATAATLPSSAVVRVIFDSGSAPKLGIITSEPSATVKTADIAGLSTGQTVVIGGIGYTVRAIEPDGTGISQLTLEIAA